MFIGLIAITLKDMFLYDNFNKKTIHQVCEKITLEHFFSEQCYLLKIIKGLQDLFFDRKFIY